MALRRDQTPTGAFSYDGNCYVFAVYRLFWDPLPERDVWVSAFTRSPNPEMTGGAFDLLGFMGIKVLGQIAPAVVQNDEFPGLPQSDAPHGLIMMGQSSGFPADGDPRLEHPTFAWRGCH